MSWDPVTVVKIFTYGYELHYLLTEGIIAKLSLQMRMMSVLIQGHCVRGQG